MLEIMQKLFGDELSLAWQADLSCALLRTNGSYKMSNWEWNTTLTKYLFKFTLLLPPNRVANFDLRFGRVPQFYRDNMLPPWSYCIYLNYAASMRLPQLASIWLLLRQPQEILLTLLVIILFWFLAHQGWFIKRAWAAWHNWKFCLPIAHFTT